MPPAQEHLPRRVIRLRDNLCRLVGLEREARIVLLHERAQGLGQLGIADTGLMPDSSESAMSTVRLLSRLVHQLPPQRFAPHL